jgi:hypothetical protein
MCTGPRTQDSFGSNSVFSLIQLKVRFPLHSRNPP